MNYKLVEVQAEFFVQQELMLQEFLEKELDYFQIFLKVRATKLIIVIPKPSIICLGNWAIN